MADVGECGRFQYLLIPLAFSYPPLAVWSMLFMVFGAKEPDWWGFSRDLLLNQSNGAYLGNISRGSFFSQSDGLSPLKIANAFSPPEGNNDSLADVVWGIMGTENEYEELRSVGVLDVSSYKLCTRGNDRLEHVVFAPGLHTAVVQFELVCDRAWVVPLTISVQMLGVLLGACLGGQLGDSVGRKTTVIAMTVFHAAFNLFTAFSGTWQMFTVGRALVGLTIGGILACLWPYPTEFIGTKWRSLLGSVPFWGVGSVTFSLLVWVLPHWSHVHLVTAGCTVATLPIWCFLPESVRWLATRGHVKRAHEVLCTIARWNGRSPPSMRSLEQLEVTEREKKYTYFHLLSTWPVAKISLLNGFMWFSASLAYYGISFGVENLSGDFNLNFFLMSVVEIPPTLCVYVTLRWFGRRWTCAGSFFLAAASCWAATSLSHTGVVSSSEAETYINGLCIVAKVGLNLGWSAMTVFAAELYPTVIRSIGLGFLNTVARVSGIVAPYVVSMNEAYIFFATVGTALTLTGIAPLLLRETGGQPLQDLLPDESQRMEWDVNAHELVVLSENV